MSLSYAFRMHGPGKYEGARGITHYVRWQVGLGRFRRGFSTRALADGFRAKLIAHAHQGFPFDMETGEPYMAEFVVPAPVESWYDFACSFVDMKWPDAAGKSRMGFADTLATVTPALLVLGGRRPSGKEIRAALYGYSFNSKIRGESPAPAKYARTVEWIAAHCRPVSDLEDAEVFRAVMSLMVRRMDGKPAAEATISRKRAVFYNAMEYAVERELLTENPMVRRKARRVKVSEQVDRRVVVNPTQARALLDAVRGQGGRAPELVALFGLMYYSAHRPAEAANVHRDDLELPTEAGEWGTVFLPGSAPTTGAAWSESGTRREVRGLKHRPRHEVRPTPIPPPLAALLRTHLDTFGTARDGRLFRGARGGDLSDSVYGRVWKAARIAALTTGEAASPLARRPYDLRHAAVSTWLNGGVPPTQVAEWAGHSVAVLLRVYAKCLAGGEADARAKVGAALGLVGQIPVKD